MGRYLFTVVAVMADSFVSALSWVGHVSPAAAVFTLFSSGFGVVLAARKIADAVITIQDDTPSISCE